MNWNHPLLATLFLWLMTWSLKAQENPVNADSICKHIERLAADEFMGRKSGTPGEEKAIHYIKTQYEAMGLKPAAGDSYFQQVHLANYTVEPPASIQVKKGQKTFQIEHQKDFLLASTYTQKEVSINGVELVFAGFGIYAPEIGWDDYKDVDVRGKIVVVLSDVPGEYTTDSTLWKGDPAANLYAKSFYKKNEAAARGAIGLLSIYKQSKQGLYTWESIANYVGKNDLTIKRASAEKQLRFSGVLTQAITKQLFQWSGRANYDFKEEALKPDFKPVHLGLKLDFQFSNSWEDLLTHNVVGVLPGTDLADEVIIYSAHWDHVGILPGAEGDSIRNGAVDNASGTAAILEIARAYKKRPNPPRRSILFLATGAEEMGLLGSVWYNAHPLFPIGKTVANFNMDAHFPYGKTTHIAGVVYGRSELDKYLDEAARLQGRTIVPNTLQNIAADIFFRSDHFPFTEVGVPAEFAVGMGEAMGHDNTVYQQKMAAYQHKYHQPSDEYDPTFNCEGIAQDAELIFRAGSLIDREGTFPQWDEKQPFARFRYEARHKSGYFHDVSPKNIPLMATQGRSMDAKPADIDQDGDLDLIVTGEWSYNLVLINDGRGKFADETMARLPLKRHDSEDIAIADFDGDSDLDLIFVSEDDEVNEYYLNDGRGYFEDHAHKLPVTGKSNAVVSFDINEDGYPDLVIGNNGVNYCLIKDATNNGWIESPDRIPASSKTTQDIEMGDFDGDGDLDLICGNEDDNEVWINDGKGFFKDETAARLPMEPSAWETREVDLGDVDGDGDLDLFLANVNFRQNKDAQNRLFFNDGKGFFRDKTATHLPAEKMHSVDGDFVDIDADGDLDIITGNSFGNSFACYLNDGKGNFVNATDKVLPPSVKGDGIDIEAADFNGDGIIDLYFCNFMGSDLLLLGLQRKR